MRHERPLKVDLGSATLALGINGFSGLVAHVAIARVLGRDDFGIFVSALALAYLLRFMTRFGGVQYVVREGARQRSALDAMVWTLARLTAAGTILMVAVAAAVSALLGFGRTGVLVAIILALMSGADCVTDSFRAALYATHRVAASSAITAGTAAVSAAAIIGVLLAGGGVVAVAIATAGVSLAAIPVGAFTARRLAGIRTSRAAATAARPFIRSVRPYAATTAFSLGVSNVDQVMVRSMLGTGAAGAYGGPYRIFAAIGWLAHAYASVLLPRLARLEARSHDAYVKAVMRAALLAATAVLPLSIIGAALSRTISVTVFGPGFEGSALAMRILFLALPLTFASVVLRQSLLAGGRARTAARILGAALTVNTLGNLLLIPTIGIEGAALMTLVADALVTATALTILSRSRKPQMLDRQPALR